MKFAYVAFAAFAGAAACGSSGSGARPNEASTGAGTGNAGGSSASSSGASPSSASGSGSSGTPPSGGVDGSISSGPFTGNGSGSTSPSSGGIASTGGDASAAEASTSANESGSPSSGGPASGASGTSSGSSGAAVDPSWGIPVQGTVYSGATVSGAVKVDPATPVGKVGVGFAGFSFEKTHITNGSFSATNTALINLMKLLPGTVMRLGANDVDKCIWSPSAPVVNTAPTFSRSIGQAAVDGLAAFVKATGAHVIYGVDFKSTANGALEMPDAQEAAYVMNQLGSVVDGFEIGNEIDGGGLSWASVKSKWELIQSTMARTAPSAKFIGPAGEGAYQDPFDGSFASDEASKIVTLTQHYYAGTAAQAGVTNADYLNKLLVPDPFALTDKFGLLNMLTYMNGLVAANKIPGGIRIGECNTFSHHGVDGVSNALISALWSLDYMFTSAANGATGVNFHGGQPGMDGNTPFYYTPIEERGTVVTNVNPVFYGMLLFTLAGSGSVLATTATSTAAHFTAYSLARTDGAMSVVVDNKDATTGIAVTVDVGKSVGSASAIYLQGPSPASLTAPSGVTLAGAGITTAGTWARKAPYALATTGNTFTVTIPPASAALVRVP